jgi:hypothetical protein
VFLINSRYPLSLRPPSSRRSFTTQGHTFSRSYGVNLPSSLTRVLSSALEYSSHLPVSVCGTGNLETHRLEKLFLEAWLNRLLTRRSARHHPQRCLRISTPTHPLRLHLNPITGLGYLLRPSLALTCHRYRNINRVSIDYAFRPRLRTRLTLGGLTLPRKPWVYGDRISHLFYRYSCLHDHFWFAPAVLTVTFSLRSQRSEYRSFEPAASVHA